MTQVPVTDEELILYHFREALPQERVEHIQHELAQSSLLKRRYDRLCAVLAAVDSEPAPQVPADFERIWSRVRARIHTPSDGREIAARARNGLWSRFNVGLVSATVMVLTFGAIFLAALLRCSAK